MTTAGMEVRHPKLPDRGRHDGLMGPGGTSGQDSIRPELAALTTAPAGLGRADARVPLGP